MSESSEPLETPKEELETKEPGQQIILRQRRMKDLRRQIRKRKRWRLIEFFLYLLAIGTLVVVNYSFREVLFQEGDVVVVIFTNAIAVGAMIGLISNFVKEFAGEIDTKHLESELDNLQVAEEVRELFRVEKPPSYFDSLVEVNLGNLRRYYDLVRVHADNSFRTSLLAGIVGFILIAVGLSVGFSSAAETREFAYLSAASGLFIEFIAGVFFYLYSRTVQQLKAYHDSLLEVQDVLLSLKLVESLPEDNQVEVVIDLLKLLMERERGFQAQTLG